MWDGADDDHDIHQHVDNDDHDRSNDINHHPACNHYDATHHGPCYDNNGTLLNVDNQQRAIHDHDQRTHDDESDYILVRRSDLDDLRERLDSEYPCDDAARTLVDNAVLAGTEHDPTADRPDDNDAMRAYILERARYDAGIADHADIFGALRDAARGFLTAAGDAVTS